MEYIKLDQYECKHFLENYCHLSSLLDNSTLGQLKFVIFFNILVHVLVIQLQHCIYVKIGPMYIS
jgi:hypothetical protein